METMTWSRQTTLVGETPVIVAEYLLNDFGVFIKREKRMPKKDKFTALTGFRIGYKAIPGTDYRAAPLDRNAILRHKVTLVKTEGDSALIIKGNSKDSIILSFDPEQGEAVMTYIERKRQDHPVVGAADDRAASWICWRDDDDWGDPQMTLIEMVALEEDTERFIELEVLEETRLAGVRDKPAQEASSPVTGRPKFCSNCGFALPADGNFCPDCGKPIQP